MCYGLNDSDIGLMRNNPSDVVLVEVITFSNKCAGIAHVCYSELKHRAAFLMQIVHAMVDGEIRRTANRTASLQAQERKSLSIRTQEGILPSHALFKRRLKHNSGSTVTKNRASGAVCVIHDAGHLVGTANNDFLIASALDHT